MNARVCSYAVIAACFLTSTAAASISPLETIGGFDIFGLPSDATLINGSIAGGGNLSDPSTAVSEAFTGVSILDDALINVSDGTTFEISFSDPITNVAGVDEFILVEGAFGGPAGSYEASLDFAASSPTILEIAPSSFANIFSGTSFTFNVFDTGASIDDVGTAVLVSTFDLTALGVPDGGSISSFQLRADDVNADPLGLGVLTVSEAVPEPTTLAIWLTLAGIALHRRR